jgi:hypothetical protein
MELRPGAPGRRGYGTRIIFAVEPPGTALAIEHNADAAEVRTLAGYVEALGGRLEVIADFGGEQIALS